MNSLASIISIISNAQRAGRVSVSFITDQLRPSSKSVKLLSILSSEGFISHYSFSAINKNTVATVFLKYDGSGRPAIRRVFKVSTSSRRVYVPSSALWQWQTNSAVFIISTTHGLVTDRVAREYNLGGEVLFGVHL